MTATLWQPQATGILASIWYPGGGGEGPVTCDLAEQTAINYDHLNGPVFLENFTGTEGTELVGVYPTYGGSAAWATQGNPTPTLLQGSAVTTAPSQLHSASAEYTVPFGSGIRFHANIGVFAQVFGAINCSFESGDNGGFKSTAEILVDVTDSSITLTGRITDGFTEAITEPVTLDYCSWHDITLVPDNGSATLSLYVGVNLVSSVNMGSLSWYDDGTGKGHSAVYLVSEENYGVRVAALYLTQPLA